MRTYIDQGKTGKPSSSDLWYWRINSSIPFAAKPNQEHYSTTNKQLPSKDGSVRFRPLPQSIHLFSSPRLLSVLSLSPPQCLPSFLVRQFQKRKNVSHFPCWFSIRSLGGYRSKHFKGPASVPQRQLLGGGRNCARFRCVCSVSVTEPAIEETSSSSVR